MYLKSLEMLGFKSFAEARIEFPSGVTAIVGPNGSGKSNVVDAILWVLGEQSTKTLRSEKMEDVIFNGTEVRKPLGLAEVSLVIGGLDHVKADESTALPSQLSEYQELMITRRLYRNGDSEYLINKTLCRLKDIRSILLDTRAGTKGHTVIAQGQIDQILNASPQDRRELIEETAGIVRYKKQKAEALRKLEATQQNLLRVRDIIAEVKKQLNSLERQARQARSYKVLQEEARTLEIQLLTNEYQRLRAILAEVERELETLRDQESLRGAEQARFNADLERIRLAITDAGVIVATRREELSRVEQQQTQALTAAEVERNRSELFEQQRVQGTQEHERLTKEREELQAAEASVVSALEQLDREASERAQVLSDLDREMKTLQEQRAAAVQEEERGRLDVLNLAVLVANTEQSLEQLASRILEAAEREQRLVREREEIQHQHDATIDKRLLLQRESQELEGTVARLRQQGEVVEQQAASVAAELANVEQLLSAQSEEFAAVGSRLRALEGVLREDMGYGRPGDEESPALKACKGVHDAVAEWLVVPEGLDRAVESILGERVRGWFVDSPQTASQAIAFLLGNDLGRGTFIPQAPRWHRPEGGVHDWWPAVEGQSGVLGRAVDLIHAEGSRTAARDYLFDQVVFVESLQDAVRLWEGQLFSAPIGPTFVTKEGEILDAAGVVTGGQASSAGGLLQRRREVADLETYRVSLGKAVEELRQRREQLTCDSLALREEARRLADTLRDAQMRALSVQKDTVGIQHLAGDLTQRIEALTGDAQRGSLEMQRLEQDTRSGKAQLAQWIAEKTGQEASLQSVRARLHQIDSEMQGRQHRLTEAQVAFQSIRTAREHKDGDVARIRQEQQDVCQRMELLQRQIESLRSAIHESRRERDRQETLCRELGQSAETVKAQLVEAQERQTQDMTLAQEIEAKLEDVRAAVSALRESRMGAEVRRAEIRTQLGTVESTLAGTYQVDLGLLNQASQAAEQSQPGGDTLQCVHVEHSGGMEDELRQQLQKIRERLDRMGAINLAAINEHQELEERYRFLSSQEQDLSTSIASLKEIIQRINRTTKDMFATTYAELQEKFGEVFTKFFPGGRAELQLVEVPAEEGAEGQGAQEPGVEIVAQPPGKRLKNITMLSGGEKTLTAMALLFASFLIRPTPFCILDEIDAPLDEENIGRFTGVLCELARDAQFIVITHNKRTMGVADSLFGVTMEEPGISKLVSVRLSDLQPA